MGKVKSLSLWLKKYPFVSLFLPIFFLGIFTRFFLLDRIPIGITGDELDYVLNAKAVFLSWSDLSGTWNPLSFSTPPFEMPKGEIPYLLLSPIVGSLPFSLFSARLLHVVLSCLFMGALFLLTRKLIGRTQAYAVLFMSALNPWSIWFGRTAYDTPLSVYFYLFALVVLVHARRWWILMAGVPFALAFFGYVGTKSILIPFVGVSILYSWLVLNRRKFGTQYLLLSIFCIGIFLFFIFHLRISNNPNRSSDILTPNNEQIGRLVDAQRRESINSRAVNIVSNKYWVYFNEASRVYLGAFSPNLLFTSGEQTAFISLHDQGFFYPFEIIFVPFGIYFLFKKKRKELYLLGSLILISPIPSVLSNVGVSYAIRSSLLVPPLLVLLGTGMVTLVRIGTSKRQRSLIVGAIALGYVMFYGNFFVNYFLKNPIYASETFNLSGRIVASYMDFAEKSGREVWIVESSSSIGRSPLFRNYLFYSNALNGSSKDRLQDVYKQSLTEFGTISLKTCKDFGPQKNTLVVAQSGFCQPPKTKSKKLSIARLSDGGEIYTVWDPGICSKYELKRYPRDFSLSYFQIESLGEKEFCTQFVNFIE